MLKDGQRLEKPDLAPTSIKQLMAECWNTLPENRPTFAQLEEKLDALLNQPSVTYFDCNQSHRPSSLSSIEHYMKMSHTQRNEESAAVAITPRQSKNDLIDASNSSQSDDK